VSRHYRLRRLDQGGRELETGLTRIRYADTFRLRLVGLLGRSSLASDEGLLLQPGGSIHTFFMRFSLDLVFLGDQHRVLRICEGVGPWQVRLAPKGTRSVLEIAEGNVKRTGIHLDDLLLFD